MSPPTILPNRPPQWIDDYALYSPGGLSKQDDDMAAYMMRLDVQQALHISEHAIKATKGQWPSPPQGFQFQSQYRACNRDYQPGAWSMLDFYRMIAPKLAVTLVYNGDSDPCVSYEGTRLAISRVGFAEVEGGSYRPWFYAHSAADAKTLMDKAPLFGPDLLSVDVGPQFGGEIVDYE